jgi:hypothetical protein
MILFVGIQILLDEKNACRNKYCSTFHYMKKRISILSSKHIDKKMWDACVAQHDNGLVYSTTTYLDAMAQNWHGLVVDEYTVVMALPWKRKFRIRYGYTPAFIQQLGLVGDVAGADLPKILKLIYKFYAFADFNFNFSNHGIQQILPVIPRTNFLIDLSVGYDQVKSHYKSNLKENIRKAGGEAFAYAAGLIDEGIAMYHDHYKARMKHVREKDYLHFKQLCRLLEANGQCFARTARNQHNEILAFAVFLRDGKRIYNIMNTTTVEGRTKEANHFLLNRVLHEFAGEELLFDFEGSELSGVREFYENFGPVNQPYFHYHYNGYTWPLHLLRK